MILRYLMALCLILALAQAEDHHKKDHHYYRKDLTYLQLSTDQETQMKAILKDYRHHVKKFRKMRETMSKKKQALFLQDAFDVTKLKDINRKLWQGAFEVEVRFLTQVHGILTPKQRKEFAEYSDAWNIE